MAKRTRTPEEETAYRIKNRARINERARSPEYAATRKARHDLVRYGIISKSPFAKPIPPIVEPCVGCLLAPLCTWGLSCQLWRRWVDDGRIRSQMRGRRLEPLTAYLEAQRVQEIVLLRSLKRGRRLRHLTEESHEQTAFS